MSDTIKYILDFNFNSIKDFPKRYQLKQIDYFAGQLQGLWIASAITGKERDEYKEKLTQLYDEVVKNGTEDFTDY